MYGSKAVGELKAIKSIAQGFGVEYVLISRMLSDLIVASTAPASQYEQS